MLLFSFKGLHRTLPAIAYAADGTHAFSYGAHVAWRACDALFSCRCSSRLGTGNPLAVPVHFPNRIIAGMEIRAKTPRQTPPQIGKEWDEVGLPATRL